MYLTSFENQIRRWIERWQFIQEMRVSADEDISEKKKTIKKMTQELLALKWSNRFALCGSLLIFSRILRLAPNYHVSYSRIIRLTDHRSSSSCNPDTVSGEKSDTALAIYNDFVFGLQRLWLPVLLSWSFFDVCCIKCSLNMFSLTDNYFHGIRKTGNYKVSIIFWFSL